VVPAPLQGGEPIVVDGHIVGAIGVSGAASAVRDQVIAAAGDGTLANGRVFHDFTSEPEEVALDG
jgi:uncharacterized protein GlcG (DUF336 family)